MTTDGVPLSYVSSAGSTNLQITSTLPSEVAQCLQNARFLHLATCTDLFPHVSLMNYTYLPTSPYSTSPIIIMTTNPSSKKTHNLVSNPHVSLLVHDWVSHRPPTAPRRPSAATSGLTSSTTGGETSVTSGLTNGTGAGTQGLTLPPEGPPSSLAALLLNLNSSALSSISATIDGDAMLVDRGTEEEDYYRLAHVENNTFNESERVHGAAGSLFDASRDDGGRGSFIEGEEVRVVIVKIKGGRVADWKGGVRDWTLGTGEEVGNGLAGERLLNGV